MNPNTPIIMYINKSGALLERMATSGADIISLDWTVTIEEARLRIGEKERERERKRVREREKERES